MKMLKKTQGFLVGEKVDWLDKQSYFGKYFLFKIRRLLMNYIYKIWDQVKDSLLEKYFAEIKFRNNEKTFEAYMPFIILARNRNEAENVIGDVNDGLSKNFSFTIISSNTSHRITNNQELNLYTTQIGNGYKGRNEGWITFETRIGKKTKPEVFNQIPFTVIDAPILGDFKTVSKKDISYQVITDNGKPLYQHEKYYVTIDFLQEYVPETSTPTDDIDNLERIRELMRIEPEKE